MYQISLVCERKNDGKKLKVQTDQKPLEALFKIISGTAEIAKNDVKVTALWPTSGVLSRQKLVDCRHSKPCSRRKH